MNLLIAKTFPSIYITTYGVIRISTWTWTDSDWNATMILFDVVEAITKHQYEKKIYFFRSVKVLIPMKSFRRDPRWWLPSWHHQLRRRWRWTKELYILKFRCFLKIVRFILRTLSWETISCDIIIFHLHVVIPTVFRHFPQYSGTLTCFVFSGPDGVHKIDTGIDIF